MIKSLLGGGLVRLLQALDPTPEKGLVIDASGNVVFEDRLASKQFTLGITAATPGDLAVAISSQTCRYDKIGDFVFVNIIIAFTPTYTTATGNLVFTGLPFPASNDANPWLIPMGQASIFTWSGTATQMFLAPAPGATTGSILATKSGGSGAYQAITSFASGSPFTLRFAGFYRTTRN